MVAEEVAMNIKIHGKTEDMLNAALQSGQFASIEEFIESMANRWQAEQKALSNLPHRINIEELAASQLVAPFTSSYQAPAGLWPENESADEFIQFVRQERRDSHSGLDT